MQAAGHVIAELSLVVVAAVKDPGSSKAPASPPSCSYYPPQLPGSYAAPPVSGNVDPVVRRRNEARVWMVVASWRAWEIAESSEAFFACGITHDRE